MQALEAAGAVFRETDPQRLIHRLSAVTGEDLAENEVLKLAEGDLSLIQQLDAPAQQGVLALVEREALGMEARGELERIVGPTADYVSVAFLARAGAAARSVARVVDLDRRPIGTGLMVSPVLFMTNHHVTSTPDMALGQLIQFDYELGVDDAPIAITEFRLDPGSFWFTSPQEELDVAIVAVSRRVSGARELGSFGFAALRSGDDKHAIGDFVTIIEHPDGRFKQVALRENRVIGRGQAGRTLHYGADTLPGASGSPVFNDSFELVALHHAGGHLNDAQLDNGQPVPDESNEGIRVSAIMSALRSALDGLSAPQRSILAGALDPPFRGPIPLSGGVLPESSPAPGQGLAGTDLAPLPPSGAELVAGADGWVRATLPVQIAIQVGRAAVPAVGTVVSVAAGAPMPAGAILERNDPPDPLYEGRRGYSPGFLAVDVPLPGPPAAAAVDVAQPAGNDAGDPVLRYLHFSIVQNGSRKMPYFTAVNIDGRRSRSINRETGEVEAAETWYQDPRVDGLQLAQSLFSAQQPRIFDRGHLVRRLDPAWGSRSVAKRASDDTFHFTNCCPQVSTFNQSARIWQGIEDYALDNARLTDERISVFTGPVFGDADPEFRGIRVPTAFWKVVVRVEAAGLRATGFLASQQALLDEWLAAPEAFAGWGDLGRVEVYQQRIDAIAAATGLAFGDLAGHDTAPPAVEAVTPLASLADVAW